MDTQKNRHYRPIPGLSRKDEEEQLAGIIQIAQDNLEKTEKAGTKLTDELHELTETYGTKDKEALAMFHNTQSQLRENQRDLFRSRKARSKPYFGRIDFKDPKIPYAESYYVGRVGISKDGSEPVVIDWRAPIASVYYENNMGPCTYTVKKEGTCKIDLKRKRTYEIAEDRLIDFFDSDVVANDELLTRYLARNKSAVLGEIIATIQKEQNAVIRRSPKMNLIVQGVAGSGKTTVAMHRISYILYNYGEEFRPEDFYIIGSNRILLNYITGVLPDLDVYGAAQMTMEELFVRLLYEDWDPEVCHIRAVDRTDRSVWIKGSYEWFHDLEMFCTELERNTIPRECVRMENGVPLMKSSTIRNCMENNPLVSMQGKINMLNHMLRARLENEVTGKSVTYPPDVKKELFRKYRRHFGKDVWKGSIFEVYQNFLRSQKEKGKTVPFTENSFDLYDLAALAYIYKRIKEIDGVREASHVIIDEAQDFGMMAYGALAYCLRGCTYTIMGDVSQNIHYGYGLNDWEDLKGLMLRGTTNGFAVLRKSYRNTVEISNFATDILRHGSFPVYPVDPIERHGSGVSIRECTDREALLPATVDTIRKWMKNGRETIAVICRDEAEASDVSRELGRELPLADSNPETAEFTEGIMVLPVEYTKGLEFDAVILYDPTETACPSEDRYVKLLYVAATRALHELSVIYTGKLTGLIADPVPEEKEIRLIENPAAPSGSPKSVRNSTPSRPMISSSGSDPSQAAIPGKAAKPLPDPGKKIPVNPSGFAFGALPDSTLLRSKRPSGPDPSDLAICNIKRTKNHLDLISQYGILRLTPITESVIRVRFHRRDVSSSGFHWWDCRPEKNLFWTARAGKSLAELSTGKITVQIDKRSGAIRFLSADGRRLLSESAGLPRQIEPGKKIRTWEYFNWAKEEKLSAKGILSEDLERMTCKARYISFGGKHLRMPLLVSGYGYGIGIASEETVLCCTVPMYGTYIHTEGDGQIDYYFLYGEDYDGILELYRMIQGMQDRTVIEKS